MYRGGALPLKSLYSIYTAQEAQCNTSTTLYASYFPIVSNSKLILSKLLEFGLPGISDLNLILKDHIFRCIKEV
jgi:hypothetical protein